MSAKDLSIHNALEKTNSSNMEIDQTFINVVNKNHKFDFNKTVYNIDKLNEFSIMNDSDLTPIAKMV